MEKLYEQYGKLMIQAEIINNQVQEVKKQISIEMSKPKVEHKVEKEENK